MTNSISMRSSSSPSLCLEDKTVRWHDRDKGITVDLSLKRESLDCILRDCFRGLSKSIPLEMHFKGPVHFASAQARFDFLSERTPAFINDENFVFRLPCLRKIRLTEHVEVCLAQGKQDLIWEVFDRSTGVLHWTFVSHQICLVTITPYLERDELDRRVEEVVRTEKTYRIPSDMLAKRTLFDARILRGISMESRIDYLRDYTVDKVEYNPAGELVSLNVKKIAVSCMFDRTLSIDCDQYAVTFLSRRQCEGKKLRGPWTPDHAEIFVEGVKKGAYFLRKCHLTPRGVQSRYVDTHGPAEEWNRFRDDLVTKYGEAKVKTWLCSKNKVERMLTRIRWEIDMQTAGYKPVLFDYVGRYTLQTIVFSSWQTRKSLNWDEAHNRPIDPLKPYIPPWGKPDNCTSWALDRLCLADITELSTGALGLLAQVPNYLAADFKSIVFV